MQRVEDFSKLFRLKQSRQKKNAKQAMKKQFWRIYSPVYLQTNPRHRPERERKKTKKKRIVNRSRDFPVHRPGGRSTAVKSGWVNRFHLSDSQPASQQQCVLEQNKARRQTKKTWRRAHVAEENRFSPSKVQPYACVLGGGRFLNRPRIDDSRSDHK